MSTFATGIATIDDQMILRKADDAFHSFIGQDIYAPITYRMYSADTHRFTEALDELRLDKCSKNVVALRIKDYEEIYHWVVITLTKEPFDLNGRPLYHVVLTPFYGSDSERIEVQRLQKENDVLYQLIDASLLTYDSETELLDIYAHSDGLKVSLFHGSLADWEHDFTNKETNVAVLNEFRQLCSDIKEGKEKFSHTVMTGYFSKDGKEEPCIFRCNSIHGDDTFHKVIGSISTLNHSQSSLSIADFTLDAGIPILNKQSIIEYAKRALLTGRSKVYLTILDLDNFKAVNDTFGHFYGDEVLSTVADIITKTLGDLGVAGRIGGDEIMIILTGIQSHAELRNTLRSIRTNIEWTYKDLQENLRVTCSMGVAAYPDHATSYESLFQLADRMLYTAKKKGKNRYVIYTPELHNLNDEPDKTDAFCDSVLDQMKRDKTGVMQRLTEGFLVQKIVTYERAMTEILYAFELDEIVMVYDNMQMATSWTKEKVTNDMNDPAFLNPGFAFFKEFDVYNTLITNNFFYMEEKAPQLVERLRELSLESCFFYKMTHKESPFGYVLFAKKNIRQQWSEYEKTMLALAGKIIELSMLER